MSKGSPWWYRFFSKKKAVGPKDSLHTHSDSDSFAQHSEKQQDPAADSGDHQEPGKDLKLFEDNTFDDSQLDPYFNEKTCRRKYKISHSGRFKDKKRLRSTLPVHVKETENEAPGKEDFQ